MESKEGEFYFRKNEQSKLESFSQKGIDKFRFRKYNRLVPQKGG